VSAAVDAARAVADAVLYEGFLLYPYTASALKNRMRWQFGVVMPPPYADKSEPSAMETEFLAAPRSEAAALVAIVRFLEVAEPPVEREITLELRADSAGVSTEFAFDSLCGAVTLQTVVDGKYLRAALRVENRSVCAASADRNEALRAAFVGTHALLTAADAAYVSLLDPPDDARAAAGRCANRRWFPVLAGERRGDGRTSDVALASPIILYDYPALSKQSAGHTFDGTEIDELLLLSVNAMTDEEKREARATHERARSIVDRAEAMDGAIQQNLHGKIVRVFPKRRADAFDMFAQGRAARVRGVHRDVDGRRYVSVVFEDDPATDLHDWYGRAFFYETDEVEPVEEP